MAKKFPHLGPKSPIIPVCIDSGAHSIYNKFMSVRKDDGRRIHRIDAAKSADYSFIKSAEFRQYLADYLDFISKTQHLFTFHVTLDVIHNAKASWEIYKEITEANGFKVLPVFHSASELTWLKKYMDTTDYIGVGGLSKEVHKKYWLPKGKKIWELICDSKGIPRVKVHGFAVTSFDLLIRYPWYSVDSTTAFTFARMGAILMPKLAPPAMRRNFNYLVRPTIVPVTDGRGNSRQHILHKDSGGAIQGTVNKYLGEVDLSLEDVRDGSAYVPRDIANLYFYNQCMQQVSAWHSENLGTEIKSTLYASGNPSSNMDGFFATLEYLKERDQLTHLAYMGTFYKSFRYPVTYLLKNWYGKDVIQYEDRRSRKRTKALQEQPA